MAVISKTTDYLEKDVQVDWGKMKLKERNIAEEWLWLAWESPDQKEPGIDGSNLHYLRVIQARDNRILTLYFDQRLRNQDRWNRRLKIDRENDALYFRLDESEVFESEEVQPGVILDLNSEGRLVGIEILELSARVDPDMLHVLQFGTG
jgi:uncharacterized protein YuzE